MPHATPGQAFISYSRSDYYFAESLAFHLLQRGVPAWLDVKDLIPGVEWERKLLQAIDEAGLMLLVASPAAMKSANVRQEWQRALEQGKRIVVLAWYRRTQLPAELRGCERVDFRGAFAPALTRLLRVLDAPGRAAAMGRLPRVPPWVAAMIAALAVPLIGYAIAVSPQTGTVDADLLASGFDSTAQAGMLFVFGLALIWLLCVSFVQRRMGMTRLLLCLGFVGAPFVYALGRLALGGAQGLSGFEPVLARNIAEHWDVGLFFIACALAGVAALVLWRPEDLLRWAPTGKVWPIYRVGRAGPAKAEIVDAARAFERVGRYRLLHDAVDEALAERLHGELAHAGARASDDPASATTVLLLSNQTRLVWLEGAGLRTDAPLLTVVGSAIALPESLDWLWKRQWVDFRQWDAARPARERGLPMVPESVHAPRLPASVKRTHRLLCALGALLVALGGALQPEQSRPFEDATPAETWGLLTAIVGWALVWPARGLLRRSMTQARFDAWRWGVLGAGVPLGLGSAWLLWSLKGAWLPITLGSVALLLMAGLAWMQRAEAVFWCPQTTGGSAGSKLTPRGDWRTTGTFVLLLFAWMVLLGLVDKSS